MDPLSYICQPGPLINTSAVIQFNGLYNYYLVASLTMAYFCDTANCNTCGLVLCAPQSIYFALLHLFHIIMSPSDIYCRDDPGIPKNGQRDTFSRVYTSVVRYSCFTGYTLQGSDKRTCQSNEDWSGSLPQCNRRFIGTFSR